MFQVNLYSFGTRVAGQISLFIATSAESPTTTGPGVYSRLQLRGREMSGRAGMELLGRGRRALSPPARESGGVQSPGGTPAAKPFYRI